MKTVTLIHELMELFASREVAASEAEAACIYVAARCCSMQGYERAARWASLEALYTAVPTYAEDE